MKIEHYSRETLLYILFSYKRLIDRNKTDAPIVLIDDLEKSINYVLNKNGYTENDYHHNMVNYNYKESKEG